MLTWLFGKSYDIEIATLNKIIGDLQEKCDKLEQRLSDLNIEAEIDNCVGNIDMDSLAENAIADAIGRSDLRVKFY